MRGNLWDFLTGFRPDYLWNEGFIDQPDWRYAQKIDQSADGKMLRIKYPWCSGKVSSWVRSDSQRLIKL